MSSRDWTVNRTSTPLLTEQLFLNRIRIKRHWQYENLHRSETFVNGFTLMIYPVYINFSVVSAYQLILGHSYILHFRPSSRNRIQCSTWFPTVYFQHIMATSKQTFSALTEIEAPGKQARWFNKTFKIFDNVSAIIKYMNIYRIVVEWLWSVDDTSWNDSKSQKWTVLSALPLASKNSWGWNSTVVAGPLCSENSLSCLPALKSHN